MLNKQIAMCKDMTNRFLLCLLIIVRFEQLKLQLFSNMKFENNLQKYKLQNKTGLKMVKNSFLAGSENQI